MPHKYTKTDKARARWDRSAAGEARHLLPEMRRLRLEERLSFAAIDRRLGLRAGITLRVLRNDVKNNGGRSDVFQVIPNPRPRNAQQSGLPAVFDAEALLREVYFGNLPEHFDERKVRDAVEALPEPLPWIVFQRFTKPRPTLRQIASLYTKTDGAHGTAYEAIRQKIVKAVRILRHPARRSTWEQDK